jgi:hypothetical protein
MMAPARISEHIMKLINRNPADYVGRSIIFRGIAWHIDGVDGEHVLLSRHGTSPKGKLMLHLFAECRLFPTAAEISARFPKLVRALRAVCNLTTGEAENALFGMILNGYFFVGSEALAHIGGAGRAVGLAWTHRTRVRESYARMAMAGAAG